MHKDRLKFAIVLGFALLLVIYFFKWKSPDGPALDLSEESMGLEDKSPKSLSNAQFEKAQMSLQKSFPEHEKLNRWLDENSGSMNSFSPQDQDQLEKFVSGLKPEDFEFFKSVALTLKLPAQKRILATYILIIGGVGSSEEIVEFIQAPLNAPPNPAPHSVDEATAGREKAMRVMAIDALVDRAKSDPTAKAQLAKMIPGIQDPWVKGYAEKRFREIN